MRRLHFLRGLEGGKEEEEVDKACVAAPRAECHLEGVGQPRSASGRPAQEGSGYRSSRVLSDTAEVLLFCVYCQ